MHMMGSGNRIDGATSPFIQQSFLVLLHYKSSHLVPFQGNTSLDFQPIALLSFSTRYSQKNWPSILLYWRLTSKAFSHPYTCTTN